MVIRLGMRRLSWVALIFLTALSLAFFVYAASVGGAPALWLNMGYFTAAFMSFGLLFGNLNALAMEPLGHIAGIGAAVVGSLSTLISVPLGTLVGQMFDGTVLPLLCAPWSLARAEAKVGNFPEVLRLRKFPQKRGPKRSAKETSSSM